MITLTRGEAQNVLNLLILWLDEQEEPDTETAIETLRAKLSEPEIQLGITYEEANQPEPIGYLDKNWHFWHSLHIGEVDEPDKLNLTPLYTAPPQREWQGLTDEERNYLAWESSNGEHCVAMTEAKLKGKNYDKRKHR